ncbi:MAG: hypothetical protein PWP48_1755 [Clostridiales bacterium]|jgi:hypothetical protein|nr:hypothetical protein [Clostridiales bacterium]
MAKRKQYEVLVILTNNAALIWKEVRGTAPDSAADKLDDVMLEWQSELTKTLKIWIDKGLSMTTGELILARANLGAIVNEILSHLCRIKKQILQNSSFCFLSVALGTSDYPFGWSCQEKPATPEC